LRIASRPVTARATRSALIVASVPDETKRTISTLGNASTISSASSVSSGDGMPYDVPRWSCRAIAATTAGCA